jgi:hypothetical protein
MRGTVRYRGQVVDARRVLQQRLHDQFNALALACRPRPGMGGR